MKIDKSITKRMDAFSKKVRDMRQALEAAHKQLLDVADHKDLKHVGVVVGPQNGDEFEVTFAGVALSVRLLSEMTNTGVALGKLNFYERTRLTMEPERLIGSISMKPSGMTDLTDEDGDEVDLSYHFIEAVLQMFEIVLRKRAGGQGSVKALSI